MLVFTDQMGRKIRLHKRPERIVSLVPSQTELLYDLGAGDRIVGITKFCIHPEEWFKTKTRVGGTKKINFEIIKKLNPDLIIGNKEENEQQQMEELMLGYPLWISDIKNMTEALQMITSIGRLIEEKEKAENLALKIESGFQKLAESRTATSNIRAAYLIWYNPIMCAGRNTFINEMLDLCGFKNIFDKEATDRYPSITLDYLRELNPELILLSSEPYPFETRHIQEFQQTCPQATIKLVDGELFSWYGSRMQYAPDYFTKLLKSLPPSPALDA